MAKAAISLHAAALYSLAIIQFNRKGGTKKDKDFKAGEALCARSAFLGHANTLRELGHCLQDGYGVTKNIAEGRSFLVQANAWELASILPAHYFRTHQDTRLQPFEPWLKNLNGGNKRQNHLNPIDLFWSKFNANKDGSTKFFDKFGSEYGETIYEKPKY